MSGILNTILQRIKFTLFSKENSSDFHLLKQDHNFQKKYDHFRKLTYSFIKSIQDPPWVVFRRSLNGSIMEYTGFCFEIINALRDFYNFS